jgi:hypothetical protein
MMDTKAVDVLMWLSDRHLTATVRKPGDVCMCCKRPTERFVVELRHGGALAGGASGDDLAEAFAAAQRAFDERAKRLTEGT